MQDFKKKIFLLSISGLNEENIKFIQTFRTRLCMELNWAWMTETMLLQDYATLRQPH